MYKTVDDIIVFTKDGSSFGIEYLEKLLAKSKKPKMIFVEKISWSRKFKMFKFLKAKIGLIDALKYNINFWKNDILNLFSSSTDYSKYADKVIYVNDINNDIVVSSINNILKTNIKIILAHASLIKSKLLDNNKIFILNAHPAKLPEIRGVDVLRWSLYKQVPLGATIHFVNRGIDTGNIIEFKEFHINNDNITIASLSKEINSLSIDLLLKYTFENISAINCMSQREVFTFQHYLMPIYLKKQLEQHIVKTLDMYKTKE